MPKEQIIEPFKKIMSEELIITIETFTILKCGYSIGIFRCLKFNLVQHPNNIIYIIGFFLSLNKIYIYFRHKKKPIM